jgi:hypothetical protein
MMKLTFRYNIYIYIYTTIALPSLCKHFLIHNHYPQIENKNGQVKWKYWVDNIKGKSKIIETIH